MTSTDPKSNPDEKRGDGTEIDQLNARMQELGDNVEKRIREIELDLATRRNYEKVAVLLGYGAIAFITLIGIIGYTNVSDIDEKVNDRIDLTGRDH